MRIYFNGVSFANVESLMTARTLPAEIVECVTFVEGVGRKEAIARMDELSIMLVGTEAECNVLLLNTHIAKGGKCQTRLYYGAII
jgi:hypothetical protein